MLALIDSLRLGMNGGAVAVKVSLFMEVVMDRREGVDGEGDNASDVTTVDVLTVVAEEVSLMRESLRGLCIGCET